MRTQQGTDSVSLLYAKQILMQKQITIDTQFLERAEGTVNIEYKKLRSATNILGDFCYVQINRKIESDMPEFSGRPD